MPERNQKHFERTKDLTHIDDFLKKHEMVQAELSRILGLSSGAISGWRKVGKAPKWTQIALEGLTRRNRQPSFEAIVILENDPDTLVTLSTFLGALGVRFSSIKPKGEVS